VETAPPTNQLQIIPQVGVDSSPSDLIALMLVSFLREKFSVGTNEIIASLHDFKYPSTLTLPFLLK
jgi:hypothetical protein